MAKFTVPAKHSPTTEETQGCVHPVAEGEGRGREIYDQMTATPSESKPTKTKIEHTKNYNTQRECFIRFSNAEILNNLFWELSR